jgi:spore cortex formation protein SpoVR/YcgB (stage V sporulation)
VAQPEFDSQYFSGINPYALGYAMMTDIKRICVDPDEEDRAWFPDIAGSDWQQTLDFAMRNFKDESFISQYLSPRLIREFKLFSILDDEEQSELEVTSIHNDAGYRHIRQALSNQYNLSMNEPNIQVYNVDVRGDRSLTLRHVPHNNVPLADTSGEVLKHLHRLWGFNVRLETIGVDGEVLATDECAA